MVYCGEMLPTNYRLTTNIPIFNVEMNRENVNIYIYLRLYAERVIWSVKKSLCLYPSIGFVSLVSWLLIASFVDIGLTAFLILVNVQFKIINHISSVDTFDERNGSPSEIHLLWSTNWVDRFQEKIAERMYSFYGFEWKSCRFPFTYTFVSIILIFTTAILLISK